MLGRNVQTCGTCKRAGCVSLWNVQKCEIGFSRVAVQGVLRRVLLPLGELRTHKKRRPPLAQDSQGSPIAGVSSVYCSVCLSLLKGAVAHWQV